MSDSVALLAKMTAGFSDEEKRQLIKLMLTTVNESEEVQVTEPTPKPVERSNAPDIHVRGVPTGRTKVRAGKNTYVDLGEDKDKDDISLSYLPKSVTPRRPPAVFVDVTCERCRKTLNVSSSLARDYYVCERCTGSR